MTVCAVRNKGFLFFSFSFKIQLVISFLRTQAIEIELSRQAGRCRLRAPLGCAIWHAPTQRKAGALAGVRSFFPPTGEKCKCLYSSINVCMHYYVLLLSNYVTRECRRERERLRPTLGAVSSMICARKQLHGCHLHLHLRLTSPRWIDLTTDTVL